MVPNARTQAQLPWTTWRDPTPGFFLPWGWGKHCSSLLGRDLGAALDHSVSNTSFMLFSIPPHSPLQEEYQEYEPEA